MNQNIFLIRTKNYEPKYFPYLNQKLIMNQKMFNYSIPSLCMERPDFYDQKCSRALQISIVGHNGS